MGETVASSGRVVRSTVGSTLRVASTDSVTMSGTMAPPTRANSPTMTLMATGYIDGPMGAATMALGWQTVCTVRAFSDGLTAGRTEEATETIRSTATAFSFGQMVVSM